MKMKEENPCFEQDWFQYHYKVKPVLGTKLVAKPLFEEMLRIQRKK